MRKLLLTPLLLLAALTTISQSADKGLFHFNLGVGVGVLTTNSNGNINNTGLALPALVGLEVGYNTHDRVSLGLETFSHTYGGLDSSVISVAGGAMGLDLKYYLTNKKKSNIYIGTTVGGINLSYHSYIYPDSGSVDSVRKEVFSQALGIYNKVYLGFNRYFGNTFGLYIKAGFLNVPLRMEYATVNDAEVFYVDKKPIENWNALFRGGFVNFGLTFKFGGKKDKAKDESEE